MKDFKEEYARMKEEAQNLKESSPEVMRDFYQMHGHAFKEGAISGKNKELMALGISVAIRCEDCIMSHVRACYRQGATYEEIAETIDCLLYTSPSPRDA